jgi:hypothetical protein
MDEGCKTSKTLFHLMTDLGMPDSAKPIPMFADNQAQLTGHLTAPSPRN